MTYRTRECLSEITIGQAVKQIIFDRQLPIKTSSSRRRQPTVVDTSDYGLVYANTANSPRPLQVYLVRLRINLLVMRSEAARGSGRSADTDKRSSQIIDQREIEMLPGMEIGGRVLANRDHG